MTQRWKITVTLLPPKGITKEGKQVPAEYQRELLRHLASMDPPPAKCLFSYGGENVAELLFFYNAATRFDAQLGADAMMKKLDEILATLKLRIDEFSVEES